MVTAGKSDIPKGKRTPSLPSYQALLNECAEYLDHPELEAIRRAYAVAARAHEGVRRQAGEPYIEHPLAVARWLAERRVAADCVAAALLHDVVEDTPFSLQQVRSRFGPVIASLVDGVTKFDAVEDPDQPDDISRARDRKRRQQAETVRKLLLAMAEDPRVALIKLADRLHNLRTLAAMRPDRQAAKARETLDIYVPLANRLGMAEVKYELEDTALHYLEPERHAYLSRRIDEEIAARAEKTEITVRALRHVLAQHGIDADVTPRVKHLYSIYRRISPYELDVAELSDLITFRVLVRTRQECYAALSVIHGQWQQLDTRLRDYIGSPKLNGYSALHTTVFGFEGLFDVHIRTFEMQLVADHGPVLLAARDPHFHNSRIQALQWIDQVRAWQGELPLSAAEFVEAVQDDLFQDQIFVVTPKGEVKDLANGATVLDLAYRIHTDLGHHCAGAKITGPDNLVRFVGPDYALQSGEIVEIVKNEAIRPNAGWLRLAQTRHAHDAIQHYLRQHDLPAEEPEDAPPPLPSEQLAQARLAYCCEPGPDDELVGFVSSRQLIIHRAGCRYATRRRSAGDQSAAPIPVRWSQLHPDHYRVTLDIMGRDRRSLIRDIATSMSAVDINLVRVGAHSISSRYKATIWVTLAVSSAEQLHMACQRLMGIDGIVQVERRIAPVIMVSGFPSPSPQDGVGATATASPADQEVAANIASRAWEGQDECGVSD